MPVRDNTDPVLFSSDHGPEAVPQTSGVAHGTRRSIPRLVDGIHIAHPNVDEVVQGRIIQRHVVGTTIQLILVESYQAPMIN